MNKTTLALVKGTGLLLSLVALAPAARADAIQTISTPTLSAATFNTDFSPLDTAVLSPFRFAGATTDSGLIESQVFQGKAGTPEAGLFAYAYQVTANPSDGSGLPNHVDSASFQFNATPIGTDLTGAGHNSFGYVISNGQIGGLSLPGTQTPTTLSWEPSSSVGFIRAQFVDPATGSGPLASSSNSSTFVVLSTQAPLPLSGNAPPTTVNVGGGAATTTVPVAYSTGTGTIEPIPVPEPATLLAWVGMASAVVMVRRIRKTRVALV